MANKIIVNEIQDSWETIIEKINNGTADYTVGQYKPLDLGFQGIVNMQIVKINPLYDSASCKPWYEFVAMETLKMEHQMNDWHSLTNEWEDSSMRTYLHKMILPLIPEVVRKSIKRSEKVTCCRSAGRSCTTYDLLWIPSYEEIFGGVYGDIYHDANSRQKVFAGTSCASDWWLRSADSSSSNFRCVDANGTANNNYANISIGVALGFSL